MNIRNATYYDAPFIKSLLTTNKVTTRTSILVSQIENTFNNGDNQILVYEKQKEVFGFIVIHFLPQLTYEGEVLFIAYLAADESIINPAIAIALEQYVFDVARKRKCYQIMAGCTSNSQFYLQQGYHKYTEFFVKKLAV